jgi:hypothetical protein
MKSEDGTVQIVLPKGWISAKLDGPGKIQARCFGKNAFALVVSEAKADFAKVDSIDGYAKLVLDIEAKKTVMPDREVGPPRKLQVNGKDALQYEVRGSLNNIRLIFVKTYIESGSHWNQVSQWTTPSHIDEARPDFDAIVKSFRDLSK